MKSRAQEVAEKIRAEKPNHNDANYISQLERQRGLLLEAIEENSIRTLDCFAVGEDLRTNPECCQLFMSKKQAEEYRRTWNPEGDWKIWPIAIYVEEMDELVPESLAVFDAIKRSYEDK